MNEKEHLPLIDQSETDSKDLQANKFKLYRRRWYILSVFTAIALLCNWFFNTWTPISEPCKILFGWENWQVILLTSSSAISLFVSSGPSVWLMDTKGLRASVILCAFLLTLGKVFHVIPYSNPRTRTILLNIGQCIAMLSCPVGLGAPPLISATWFPPEERTTATAISTLAGYFGIAVGFLVGPNMVQTKTIPSYASTHNNTVTNHTVYDIQTMTTNLSEYMGVQLGISALLLVCVLAYFPDKPPLPPCATSSSRSHEYKKEFKTLISDYRYLYLGFIFGITFGVYFGWLGLLALVVRPFGIGESLASWIGTTSVVAGIFSGVIIARLVDYIKRHTKTVLVLLFVCTTISLLLFTLTCSKIIPFSKPLLFSSIIFGGLFFNATTPLMFEMAVETVYPIAEGVTIILLLVSGNVILLIFAVVFMFPWMNVAWFNWLFVVVCGLCVPALMVYKGKLKRLELG